MLYKKKVLFICTGNSCRSQIAEGLLKFLGKEKFEVFSAGSHPSKLNLHAIKVMEEIGIDISGQKSEGIKLFLNTGIDILITVCDEANNHCPIFPGQIERIHWSIKDPFVSWNYDPDQLENFRTTRKIIKTKINEFLKIRSL